ncbi:hypothetical protein ACO22_05826 [Paracoccidioides brasiliensis]|uniref:Stc1 domain-containing protein n=1 Tax=Paracoccidioides brasiliensis TaxID=121759 RepID=A0A1D2J9E3_PARBR|nr:hypothetical protein ACO22_05826 [Paracoccidioides brasiliensis]
MAPRNRRFDYIAHNRRIRCKMCTRTRLQSAFSKRQLDLLRRCILEKSSNATTNEGLAICFNCATNQVVELTCCVCDMTMALEFFSKTQRHDPDSARCKNCVQGHLDREPVSEEDLREAIENASSYAATIITHNQGGNRHALAPTRDPATTDNAIQEQKTSHPVNLTAANQNTDDHGIDGSGMWIDARYKGKLAKQSKDRRVSEGSEEDELSETSEERELTKEGNPAREVSKSLKKHELVESSNEQEQNGDFHVEHEFVAFYPRGKPHIRTAEAPASPPSVHSGWEMLGVRACSQMASKAAAERQKRGNPGFAKTPGTRYSKNEAPTMHRPRPTERTVKSDDEDESDVDLQKYM